MDKKQGYRRCFVPMCCNTEMNNPHKLFVLVPKDENIRKKWFAMARRSDQPTSSNFYCCEDHFDLPNDMENYIRYKLMGAPRKMKSTVLPHKFDCQPDRRTTQSHEARDAFKKLNRKREISKILLEDQAKKTKIAVAGDYFLDAARKVNENHDQNQVMNHESKLHNELEQQSSTQACELDNFEKPRSPLKFLDPNVLMSNATENIGLKSVSANASCVSNYTSFSDKRSPLKHFKNCGTNCNLLKNYHYRSKGVMCNIARTLSRDKGTYCSGQDFMVSRSCSPVKELISTVFINHQDDETKISNEVSSKSSSTSVKLSSGSSYRPSTDENPDEDNEQQKILSRNLTNYFISKESMFYLRVPEKWLWVLDTISIRADLPLDHVKLTLMKIKLDDQFNRLGNQFGYCYSSAAKFFRQSVPKIANFLKQFIYQPTKSQVKKRFPLPFRISFSKVYAIIDCFEIQIEKPSDALFQSLTWSEYKKCNTIKFLLCITPDGLVIFVSCGYGGRISDIELFEDSRIMDILPTDCVIKADRGFKGISTVLMKKNIELIRPPSVYSDDKPTREQVILSKRIASVRIHVERAVRRFREFSLLIPHSTLHHAIMPLIDDIMQIVGGLINLQDPLIRV